MKRNTIGLITGILLTASALPLIAQEDASGLTLEKDGEQVLIPLDGMGSGLQLPMTPVIRFVVNIMGMTVDALRIQEKGESFEREIPMDEIGSIFTGKIKSTKEYVWGGVKLGGLVSAFGTGIRRFNFYCLWTSQRASSGVGYLDCIQVFIQSPAGALIGYIRG